MLELDESYALIPRIRRRMPTARTASETALFIDSTSVSFHTRPAKQLHGPSSLDDSHQDNHNGDNKKEVDETAHGVGRDQPQHPQDDENDSDSIKHGKFPFSLEVVFNTVASDVLAPLLLRQTAH
jgi:hypothetical protein